MFYIICGIVFWIICGFFTMALYSKKGHSGGFIIGFIFGIIGLIFAAGLPDEREKQIISNKNNKNTQTIKIIKDFTESDEVNTPKIDECPNCFTKISKTDKKCPHCEYILK